MYSITLPCFMLVVNLFMRVVLSGASTDVHGNFLYAKVVQIGRGRFCTW